MYFKIFDKIRRQICRQDVRGDFITGYSKEGLPCIRVFGICAQAGI